MAGDGEEREGGREKRYALKKDWRKKDTAGRREKDIYGGKKDTPTAR